MAGTRRSTRISTKKDTGAPKETSAVPVKKKVNVKAKKPSKEEKDAKTVEKVQKEEVKKEPKKVVKKEPKKVVKKEPKKETKKEPKKEAKKEVKKEPKKEAKKEAKKEVKKEEKKEATKEESPPADAAPVGNIVIVEACKQWGAFKTRANKIEKGLQGKATVKINEEKPGKGNFVVRVSGQEKPVVELLGMKRPFPDLKALNMEEVVENIKAVLV